MENAADKCIVASTSRTLNDLKFLILIVGLWHTTSVSWPYSCLFLKGEESFWLLIARWLAFDFWLSSFNFWRGLLISWWKCELRKQLLPRQLQRWHPSFFLLPFSLLYLSSIVTCREGRWTCKISNRQLWWWSWDTCLYHTLTGGDNMFRAITTTKTMSFFIQWLFDVALWTKQFNLFSSGHFLLSIISNSHLNNLRDMIFFPLRSRNITFCILMGTRMQNQFKHE